MNKFILLFAALLVGCADETDSRDDVDVNIEIGSEFTPVYGNWMLTDETSFP